MLAIKEYTFEIYICHAKMKKKNLITACQCTCCQSEAKQHCYNSMLRS